MVPKFSATITTGPGGKLKVHLDAPAQYETWIRSLGPDRRVDVIVQPPVKERSNRQNRYYRGVICKLLSEYTGHTKEEIHEALKWRFLRDDSDQNFQRTRSTASLTTKEFEEYVELCRQFGDEMGCRIPLPNEVVLDDDEAEPA